MKDNFIKRTLKKNKLVFNTLKKIRDIVKTVLGTLRNFLSLPIYWLIGRLPRDNNLWIFGSWAGKYLDNSRMLFEWINKNHPEIKTVWVSKDKKVVNRIRKDGHKAFRTYSLFGIFMMVRAGKAFSSQGLDFSCFFTKGAEWYSLWHGMPLKQIFHDSFEWMKKTHPKSISALQIWFSDIYLKLFPWNKRLEYKTHATIANSDFFVHILANALQCNENCVLPTGSPRCDALFYNRREEIIEKIRKIYPDCKIILYMPTFRDRDSNGERNVFEPFTDTYGFNEKEFLNALERNNCVFIHKAHFWDLRRESEEFNTFTSRFISISDEDYDELYNFVGQVDILVSDYSSIYFDFLATKKPVILCPFDYEDYIKYSRAHYFDYFEHMEGVKARNWHEFIQILDKKSYYPVSEETRKKFAEYLDGNCCQKVFDAVIARDKEKQR